MSSTVDILQSSQSFVRALKSTVDPPHEDGPTKIQIARLGWETQSLYVPRKTDLLLDWILTRFHKERTRKGHENSLLDPAHWSLLAEILTHPSDTQIAPLISRVSIPALIASFITLYPSIPIDSRARLLTPLLRALDVLWPLVVQRTGLDPLAECLWSSLSIIDHLDNPSEEGLVKLLTFVLTAFHSAFDKANTAGKKKAYNAVSQHQFPSWLRALHVFESTHPLYDHLYSVGIAILFNPDSLRAVAESKTNIKTNSDFFSAFFGPSTLSYPESRSSLLRLLPSLYRDYIMALRKHRSAIFSSTFDVQQMRERLGRCALHFGNESLAFLEKIEGMEQNEFVWRTRVHILRVTEEEGIFNLTESDEHTEWMGKMGEDALKQLDFAWNGSQSPLTSQALDALSSLHRIEPDVIVRLLPRILERLATCSPALEHPATTFFNQLISYHSKTRTLHVLVSQLLISLASSFPFLPSPDAKTIYSLCMHSPLLSLSFMDELIGALRTFMTPGQAGEVMKSVKEAFEILLPLGETSKEPPSKRRKINLEVARIPLPDNDEGSTSDVIRFTLVARFGGSALRAILQDGMDKNTANRRTYLGNMDTLISDALLVAFKLEDSDSQSAASKSRGKRMQLERDEETRWMRHCLSSALLRLWYELFAQTGCLWSTTEHNKAWAVLVTLDRLNDTFITYMREDVLPELQLEIGRVLYTRKATLELETWPSDAKGWVALDAVLDYIEANLFAGDVDSNPAHGHSSDLTKPQSALALWNLTLERYLSMIDTHASQKQLDRLVSLMLHTQIDSYSTGQAENQPPASPLNRAFASANFWELNNVRASMLAALEKHTSRFESINTLHWLSALISGDDMAINALFHSTEVSLDDIEAGVKMYRLLHYFPPDYLSRASRVNLLKRALGADVLVRGLHPKDEPTSEDLVEWRAVFRSFVFMVARNTQTKPIEEMAPKLEWMTYLALSVYGPAYPTDTYVHASLGLLSLLQASAMRAAVRIEEPSLVNVVTHFLHNDLYSKENIKRELLAQQSLLCFVGALVREFQASSFKQSVLSVLQQLCADLERTLGPAIGAVASQITAIELTEQGNIIEAWQVLLSLKRWLSIEPSKETYGLALLTKVARMMSSKTNLLPAKVYANVLSLLVEEGQALHDTDCRQVTSIIAGYVLFTSSVPQAVPACDIPMARAWKTSSVAHYGSALELVAEALEKGFNRQSQLISLMHLSTLLLREAPERTSRLSHEHALRCLKIFINEPSFVGCSPTLDAKVLDFVHYQCTERAPSLKTFDVACILSVISKLLTGCSEHDEHTSSSIFQSIVSVVSALVRSRRDLLGPHLPQLSVVLRQLMCLIRGARPLLGSKQHRIIAGTFPKWVNPSHPLGEAEARSLARLLTTLTTKTLIRSYATNDSQKAESLARPFARHAPYVLLAYLQMMNDPLSVLTLTMRRELEPGLFALCNMMGEHGRDTLMVQSLDVGGKALLKSLWKEYEKQKYIGKG